MNIYIASGFTNREYINQFLVPLLNKPSSQAPYAFIDMGDIDWSDLVVAYNPSTSTGGGTYFELGYSWAKGKRIFLVGSLSGTVFEDLFSRFEDVESLLKVLED